MGRIGVKAWIYKGDILPTPEEEVEDLEEIEVTLQADEQLEEAEATQAEPQGQPQEEEQETERATAEQS